MDLVDPLVKSFHNEELQTYAAFTTAVEQLIGSVDWVLDSANNQIVYYEEANLNCRDISFVPNMGRKTSSACGLAAAVNKGLPEYHTRPGIKDIYTFSLISCSPISATVTASGYCTLSQTNHRTGATTQTTWLVDQYPNPDYSDKDLREKKTLPLETVAQKVISNAASGDDEVLQMFSQDYITLVANSIFDSNPTKQLVTLEDLIPQFELNKILVQ